MARLYNKRIEIQKSGKTYLEPLGGGKPDGMRCNRCCGSNFNSSGK
jgi:hypothetical protein